MLFSSNIFLFAFLPFVLLCYFFLDKFINKIIVKNIFLVIVSTLFFYWGSGKYISILIASILFNYYSGLILNFYIKSKYNKYILYLSVFVNLSLLFYFKYFNFFIDQTTRLFKYPEIKEVAVPLGISFYTFQAIAYIIDVYRKKISSEKNFLSFLTFFIFFPKLIQGPIVRFEKMKNELSSRVWSIDNYFEGLWRFSSGLAKKVIIADTLGPVANKIFALPHSELTLSLSWLGIICYSFQIYFDFSGYSDMAIGLGKFFGFNIPENFNLPYISKTVTEFWQRWHISLSSWIKDYLYIPLGGNRNGVIRTCINLLIVFLLTGVWHGAGWNFILWGAYYGILLIIERVLRLAFNFKTRGILGNIFTFILVMLGWVMFRSSSIFNAFNFMRTMFGFDQPTSFQFFTFRHFFQPNIILFLLFGFILSFFNLEKKINSILNLYQINLIKGISSIIFIILSIIMMSKASFSPFLYFKF